MTNKPDASPSTMIRAPRNNDIQVFEDRLGIVAFQVGKRIRIRRGVVQPSGKLGAEIGRRLGGPRGGHVTLRAEAKPSSDHTSIAQAGEQLTSWPGTGHP